ncbi:cytochrome P450 [Penicillium cf. griseofulvum]|uniref:Cytochrome P450 n=1 Tax=Penicillium cf. griseofulvum TaxID=2972120 RepID=A0A9W9MRY1_9EURO|nr:cytochrome P450 [Penicillium cf. griseofulvum]KAJ5440640.1 cytochrome P450 [Penicillium cf. griseofulvum]KAJ5448691.1 cytochrome P450 [Penicillium cf. griseofulvum]
MWISFLPSWKKAWQTKETVIMQLIEASRSRFISNSDVQNEATCAMDEIFKREARAEAKGRESTVREMIDETFAYIKEWALTHRTGGHETTQDTTKWSMKYLTSYQEK